MRTHNAIASVRAIAVKPSVTVCAGNGFVYKSPDETSGEHRIAAIHLPKIFKSGSGPFVVAGMKEFSWHEDFPPVA